MHCWPNPGHAVAEISRVLKPGGLFIGSDVLDAPAPLGAWLGNDTLVRPLRCLDPFVFALRRSFRRGSESELRGLFGMMGLQYFKCQRSWRYIMWSVQKPGKAD